MYTRFYYSILSGDNVSWIDSLEVNGRDIDLSTNSESLLTIGLNNNSKILPKVNKVDIPKIDNKIKVPIKLNNGTIYDLILDVAKDENIQYYDMYFSSKELHLIYRLCYDNKHNNYRHEHAFVAQATKQGFYVINFDQHNNGYMYFMLNNSFDTYYQAEFSYTGMPLNFLCKFKKFTGPDVNVDYTTCQGVQAANGYRFIKGHESISSTYPIPFYIDNNELILCPKLDCIEEVTCFLTNNRIKEYHYNIFKEE